MKKNKYIIILLLILIIILILLSDVIKNKKIENIEDINLYYEANSNLSNKSNVKIKKVNENYYLFLPSSSDLSKLKLRFNLSKKYKILLIKDNNEIELKDGKEFDFRKFYKKEPENYEYSVNIIIKDKKNNNIIEESLKIMKSENVSSMFINSDNEEEYGRQWVEASQDHTNSATGNMVMIDSNNNIIYNNLLKQIRGRGNTTWGCESNKKPYQIKLNTSASLVNVENNEEKSKTWLLIANSLDPTLIRNTISYDLAKEIGLEYTPECKPIDLYYDGDYRGSYLLCEKVEVSESRVNITNLDSSIKSINKSIKNFEKLNTKILINKYGNGFQYVEQIQSAQNISGGYLVELDNAYYEKEKSYFMTTSKDYFVVVSPKYAPLNEMEYISDFFQEVQDAIYNEGINPYTGKSIEEYIDVESFTKYILLQQITKNPDAFYSSTYFYKKQGQEKIYAGPVWDFDTCLGLRNTIRLKSYENMLDINWLGKLLQLPCIQEKSKQYYSQIYELVSKTLLGNDEKEILKSIEYYENEIKLSREMNYRLWDFETIKQIINDADKNAVSDEKDTIFNTYEENIDYMKDFLNKRNKWLNDQIKSANLERN